MIVSSVIATYLNRWAITNIQTAAYRRIIGLSGSILDCQSIRYSSSNSSFNCFILFPFGSKGGSWSTTNFTIESQVSHLSHLIMFTYVNSKYFLCTLSLQVLWSQHCVIHHTLCYPFLSLLAKCIIAKKKKNSQFIDFDA